MRAVVFIFQLLFYNGETQSMFLFQKTFTYKSELDDQTVKDSDDMDRKTSLFGFSIFLNYRKTSVLVSAPGRKSPGQTYGGDFYKCYVRDLQNTCISILPDDVEDSIGIGTEHVPFLFGSSMLRMNENHIIVCQAHRGQDIRFFKHCQCLKDTRNVYVGNEFCLILQKHTNTRIPFLNMFQIKFSLKKKWVVWGSRHFPGDVDVTPLNGESTTTMAAYSGIAVWNTDIRNTNPERFYFPATTNKEWIPTIGFDIGSFFDQMTETLVVATNDDDEQSGKLFFYDLRNVSEETPPKLLIYDSAWQTFTNFGNKIVIADINNDKHNDLIVTSPTSKWIDLPEVGHVHLFINNKSKMIFSATSIIIRGIPIAHSFFGWNAEAVNDLDDDGVTDFLIAALKVNEEDLRGGVYVFLGGDERVLRGLIYYEIIQPSSDLPNEFTGFGFYISSKMVLDREENNYIMMSRVLSGEVDVYKITPYKSIKVTVDIVPDHVTIDENFILSLFEKGGPNFAIKIRYRNIRKILYATIKLSFKDSSNYHSFSDEYPLETFTNEKKLTGKDDDEYTVYFRPSYEKMFSKWILRAEITLREFKMDPASKKHIPLFHRIFYPEISLERKYRRRDCQVGYTLLLLNKPIWYQNRDTPTIFRFRLTNCRELLTHLIINAGLSMKCKITISNTEMVPIMNSHPLAFTQIRSNIRVAYNKPTAYENFDFNVQALCQQDDVKKSFLTLRLSIQSFFPHNPERFKFTAPAKLATDFTIETKRCPVITKHVCHGSEVKEIVEFNVEILFGGQSYDNELLLSIVLYLDDSVEMSVDSIIIESNNCDVITVDGLSRHQNERITQNFHIKKAEDVQNVQLSISYTVSMKFSKEFHLTLKIEPVLGQESPYELKSIMVYETKYHATFSVKYCKNEWLILIFSALGCLILISLFCYLIYYIVAPQITAEHPVVTYIVDNSNLSIAY